MTTAPTDGRCSASRRARHCPREKSAVSAAAKKELPPASKKTGLTFDKGDEVQCFVTARDATVSGVYPSGVLTVSNTAPVITSAALSTSSPQTGDTLSLTLNGPTDADGDATTVAYEWYVNGALVGTEDRKSVV